MSLSRTYTSHTATLRRHIEKRLIPLDPSAPVGSSNNPSHDIFTLANVITFARFILTCIFFILFCMRLARTFALVCYAIAAITDFLDGQVARRTQTVSWLGKIMDPIMDRVLLTAGVLGLVITAEVPLWIAIYVIGRDAILAVGAILLKRKGLRPLDVILTGKIATACLMTGFCDMLLGIPIMPALGLIPCNAFPGLNTTSSVWGICFIYVGILFSIYTFAVYMKQGILMLRDAQ